ncbi:MAG: hypothetical protein E5V36_00405 [Mesorhizobium sp.]|nr:MAG: hypothetical protein E5V36_00405 [Mesorhizobium sp.]
MNAFDFMPDCSAESPMISHHQEILTSVVARYEVLVSIQDRIVERDRRFGEPAETDEAVLKWLMVSLGKARIALKCEIGPTF